MVPFGGGVRRPNTKNVRATENGRSLYGMGLGIASFLVSAYAAYVLAEKVIPKLR